MGGTFNRNHLCRLLDDIDRDNVESETRGGVTYRKLRMAWSVMCGIVCAVDLLVGAKLLVDGCNADAIPFGNFLFGVLID